MSEELNNELTTEEEQELELLDDDETKGLLEKNGKPITYRFTKERRIRHALELLTIGYAEVEIVKQLVKTYNCHLNTAYDDVRKAKELLGHMTEKDAAEIRRMIVDVHSKSIRDSFEKGRPDWASQAGERLSKLLGINEPEKHDVNVTGIEVIFKPAGEKEDES